MYKISLITIIAASGTIGGARPFAPEHEVTCIGSALAGLGIFSGFLMAWGIEFRGSHRYEGDKPAAIIFSVTFIAVIVTVSDFSFWMLYKVAAHYLVGILLYWAVKRDQSPDLSDKSCYIAVRHVVAIRSLIVLLCLEATMFVITRIKT